MAWGKTKNRNAGASEVEQGHLQSDQGSDTSVLDDIPARRLVHKMFIVFSILTVLVALWMAVGQVLGIVVQENGAVQYVLRGYVIALCAIVILVELEWTKFARETAMLHNWISRGLLYVFIGVIGMQQNETAVVVKEGYEAYEVIADIVKAVAWNMIGCGGLYCVMGIFCLQYLLKNMRKDYQARLVRAKKTKKAQQQASSSSGSEGVEVEIGDVEAQLGVEPGPLDSKTSALKLDAEPTKAESSATDMKEDSSSLGENEAGAAGADTLKASTEEGGPEVNDSDSSLDIEESKEATTETVAQELESKRGESNEAPGDRIEDKAVPE